MKASAVLIGVAVAGACRQPSPYYAERYRGDFVYTWEGGGLFVPCEAGPDQARAALGRRFFAQLHADSIHWPAGIAPDRTHEGAVTFVVLRTPRLVRGRSDTLDGAFGAEVDSARPRTSNDCRAAALPNGR